MLRKSDAAKLRVTAVDIRMAHHPGDALYRNTCGQCQGPERMPGHVVGQVLFHA